MILFAGLTLIVGNFVPLSAIATMGSAGFLLIFLAVNVANCKLRRETGGGSWISLLGCAGLRDRPVCPRVTNHDDRRPSLAGFCAGRNGGDFLPDRIRFIVP